MYNITPLIQWRLKKIILIHLYMKFKNFIEVLFRVDLLAYILIYLLL